MEYRKLENAGIEVPVIALGCWQFAGGEMWRNQEEKDSIEAVHAALDTGITLFDTAEVYGDGKSEEVLGKALQGRRHKAIVATKTAGPTYASDELASACDKSLKRLRTDTIDIYQLHWPRPSQVDAEKIFEGVRKLKKSGKIRHFSVCNFGFHNLSDILTAGTIVSNQLSYSLLWRGIEDEIVPKCTENAIGIFTYSSLLHGLLSGRYESIDEFPANRARSLHFSGSLEGVRHGQKGKEQLTDESLKRIRRHCRDAGFSMLEAALGWLAHRPQVTSVIVGGRNAGQVIRNANIASIRFPREFLESLTKATDDLKKAFGNQADMWDFPGRIR